MHFVEKRENTFFLREDHYFRMRKRKNRTKSKCKKESCRKFVEKESLERNFMHGQGWLRLQ